MKTFKVWLVVGGILVAIGLLLIYSGLLPSSSITRTEEIPYGADWFLYLELNLEAGKYVSGDFAETLGRTVNFYIFNEQQFNSYSQVGSSLSMFSLISNSGTFSFSAPTSGKYYLVFAHSVGYQEIQHVRVTYRIAGISWSLLTAGITILAVGAVLEAFGLRLKKKQAAPTQQPADVVMFDQPRQPPPPPPPG